MSTELTVERMKQLYAEGKVAAATDWLREQHDPFCIIAEMGKVGNLSLLLAHYKEAEVGSRALSSTGTDRAHKSGDKHESY